MSQRVQMKLPIDRPVVGLRLHSARSRQGDGGAPTRASNTAQWLLDLKARADAESDAQFAVMRCIGSIVGAVKPIPALVQSRLDEIGGMVTEMALAVAREIVGEALDRGMVDPTPTVQRCLRECVLGSDATTLSIRLSPADLGPVMEKLEQDPETRGVVPSVDFEADAALQRGEVVARTGAGTLHYDPSEVLDRLCAAVREEVQQ